MVLVSSKIGRDKLFKIVWNGTIVIIRGHDSVHQYEGHEMEVSLPDF